MTTYDLWGNPNKEPKREPELLSDKAKALLNKKTPEWWSAIYKMLDELGISPGGFQGREAGDFADFLKEIGDYPIEWIVNLRETIVANNVVNIETVKKYIRASHARQIAPGEKPAAMKRDAPAQRIDDGYIEQWLQQVSERSLCNHKEPCRAAEYRETIEAI